MRYVDNVEITNESYVPGGFGVEDYLVPNKPNIDWRDVGVSYAGGFGAPETEVIGQSFAGENLPTGSGLDSEDVDLSGVQSARKRRSGLSNTMMTIADLLKISASMPNLYGQSAIAPGSAYLGMTEEEANKRAKARMEEDPEGKEIDINRAKVLSARAAATDNMDLKRKYGAAIKQLLPNETQGLDDVTASDFFNSTDNKLKLEQLKGYNKLQQIALQNRGKMDVAGANNASKEAIAAQRVSAQLQMNALDNQIKDAIATGKNETALALQDKRSELQQYIHQLDNAADYEREVLKQDSATNRTNIQQGGANWRAQLNADTLRANTAAQQEGQNYRTDANNRAKIAVAMMKPIGGAGGTGAGKGTAKERAANEQLQFRMENWDDYVAEQDNQLNAIQRAIDILNEDPNASGFTTNLGMKAGGVGIYPKTAKDYGELNELTTRVILNIIQQLNEAGATSSVFNSESEQARIIGLISDPSAPASARKKAFISFRDRLKAYYDRERKFTAWKASKMGMNVMPQQAQQAVRPNVVSATQVNNNRRKVDGGVEW